MRTVAALALLCARAAAETCFDGAPYAHFWRFFDEDVFPGLSSPTHGSAAAHGEESFVHVSLQRTIR